MKINSTRVFVWRCVMLLLTLPIALAGFSQPDYDFRNGTLKSGTDLEVGAVYRFSNVKTGVDAKVTITALTNGLYLSSIDNSSSGFKEAFQPTINVPAHTDGYAEFTIDFLLAGTNLPLLQLAVPITPIDVDGQPYSGGGVNEYDMIYKKASLLTFDLAGGELLMGFGTWGWITGTNTKTVDYPGIDTLAKQVMFTVTNSLVTSVTFRVGAINHGTAERQRLRSVYFKRFTYLNAAVLPVSSLASFSGVAGNEKVQLNWSLANGNEARGVVLEKSVGNANSFQPLTEYWVNMEDNQQKDFNYNDNQKQTGAAYYRLRIQNANGKTEYSNTLQFRSQSKQEAGFKVYPTQVSGSVTAQYYAATAQRASFEVIDYGGRVCYRQAVMLQQGDNSIRINDLGRLPSGSYIGSLKTGEQVYTQKINKL